MGCCAGVQAISEGRLFVVKDAGISLSLMPLLNQKWLNRYKGSILTRISSDKLIWSLTPHGMYTAQSFQKLLRSSAAEPSSRNDNDFPLKRFWGVKSLAPKIHNFLWRVLRNGVGVLAKIGSHIEGVQMDCPLCRCAVETNDHLFVNCQVSRAILFASPLNFSTSFISESSVLACCKFWLSKQDGFDSFCMGACLWRAICNARNKVVFEKASINIQAIINDGLFWFNTYKGSQDDGLEEVQSLHTDNQHTPTDACWIPPPPNVIKVNVDAAVASNCSYAAAVARDMNGFVLGAGSLIINTKIPIVAEVNSSLLAFTLAHRLEALIIHRNDLSSSSEPTTSESGILSVPSCLF
ncbi:uncharacterized protein LOC113351528 [Papaver somniferum]|uniref:uncharacterized protein LOC113351528 n=1 Tax=Papaver somniferum TaxID=3469 RepID=UPI000E6F6717|nr:uncharacterized protein LOC113351528 [Papaver somniferum]